MHAKQRRHSAVPPDPSAPFVRRIGWQLASLTVGLLCALLLVLGGVVYLTTQQLLRHSLEQTLKAHTVHPPPDVLRAMLASDNSAPPDLSRGFQDPSGVAFTVYNTQIVVLKGIGPWSPPLSDLSQAQTALRNGTACCDTFSFHGQDYLVYSVTAVAPDGNVVVLQANISEAQLESSLQSILYVLIAVVALGLVAAAVISLVLVRRALRPIQLALRRQRDFVADAAHELRTPLTIMRTAGEFGLAHETVAEQQGALEQMLEQNAHLSHLVESLSLLARTDSGVVQVEQQPIDLGSLANEVVGDVSVLADERRVALRVDVAPDSRVVGDSGRLRQLLLILLDNALKFTPDDGAIRVGVERSASVIRLQVQDSGPGIDPKDLPHVFERFYRSDLARTREGTGLGLSIGRWIVEAHGGRIVASNATPHGALFTVSFPAAR